MSGALTTAIIASAVIGAGATIYAANEADDAQKDAQRRADEAKRKADEMELNKRPEGESATVDFGSGNKDGTPGSYNDFLSPKSSITALGGTGGGSGIGTSSKTGLGFNV